MIRALLKRDDGRPIVVLGVDAQNLDRIREGQPVAVNLSNLNPDGPPTDLPDIDVVVAWAPDVVRLLGRGRGNDA